MQKSKMLRNLIRLIPPLALWGICMVTLFCFLAKTFWFFELFTHYTPYYASIALLFTVYHLTRRQFEKTLIWLTLFTIHFMTFAPYLLTPAPHPNVTAPTLSILSQNFYYKDDDVDAFRALVTEENPEIVIVHEASDLWKIAKEKFRSDYPVLHLTHITGIHGIFIASRIPGTFKEVPLGQEVGLVFTPDDLSYQVLAVHPPAPILPRWATDRDIQLQEIAHLAKTSNIPLIVMGDFNCTPWSPYFSELIKDSGLKDSRLGFGLIPTWHAHNPLFQLPIDHALVSPELTIQNFKITRSIDADHRGILLILEQP